MGGPPGPGGGLGSSGSSGNPGAGGAGGDPGSACGTTARRGTALGGGAAAGTRGLGKHGENGDSHGQNGPTPSINTRPAPPIGSGGGGPEDPPQCTGDSNGGQVDIEGAPCASPVIIDTEGEGFHLTPAVTGVAFDISGTGKPIQIAWTNPRFHNAFLALPGADGLVHNGKELFGNFTPQPQSAHPNGFIALAQFDKPENGGNSDGIIDEKDDVFSKLRLWIDENHDGVCQPQELHRLPELGVYSLALHYRESHKTDRFGNQFRYRARVNPGARKDPRDQTDSGDPGRWTYDVFFVVK